ncbi:MFS transporter [Methanotrichaceae archaeon M04Ac]|uniref:MFS transporter n=1 Tax=Candidatus Methanocrinis alkalitolerans TaxID=3033395 RepID=A0ABT5XDL2_9EURY|nr:MFS transporter [Candidatus Methanocrinis alkalitolerans]MCR3884809.1 MFS transporter [Methanothrix sp.]MDF0592750.1 MFS transporter [Candidatus Methanocrinis alkalitolerans]
MNRTIKLLMISDVFVLTGFGLIQPILAIFINEGVAGGTIFTAGVASTLFLVTKSLVQLPFSRYIDENGNKTRWLIIGTALIATVPVMYIFIDNIYQVYLAEILYGIGSGLAYPTWVALWTMNLKPGKEGFEWSVYSTSTGLGTAATAAAGAAIASIAGFVATFILTGFMCLVGCGILLMLDRESAEKRRIVVPSR